jgi:hypothetical protein
VWKPPKVSEGGEGDHASEDREAKRPSKEPDIMPAEHPHEVDAGYENHKPAD